MAATVTRNTSPMPPPLRLSNDLFEADELSYSKVRTLSRIATPENEQQLAAIAADVPAGALPPGDRRVAAPHEQRRQART